MYKIKFKIQIIILKKIVRDDEEHCVIVYFPQLLGKLLRNSKNDLSNSQIDNIWDCKLALKLLIGFSRKIVHDIQKKKKKK